MKKYILDCLKGEHGFRGWLLAWLPIGLIVSAIAIFIANFVYEVFMKQ